MAKNVTRKNADGIEVNFGDLVVCDIAGTKCVMEDWRATLLNATVLKEEIVCDFLDDLKLVVQFITAQVYVYPLNKADIRPLGKALSALDIPNAHINRVDVVHKGCMLLVFEDGMECCGQRTIDSFYDGMSEEEIERSRF